MTVVLMHHTDLEKHTPSAVSKLIQCKMQKKSYASSCHPLMKKNLIPKMSTVTWKVLVHFNTRQQLLL